MSDWTPEDIEARPAGETPDERKGYSFAYDLRCRMIALAHRRGHNLRQEWDEFLAQMRQLADMPEDAWQAYLARQKVLYGEHGEYYDRDSLL